MREEEEEEGGGGGEEDRDTIKFISNGVEWDSL